ncbi:MAG: penicillin-binding protein 2 [Candidatus Omnitrophota bacterium]|nr:penicillin-binding protein 2 [Candidatus Omnitrophota bacterium]
MNRARFVFFGIVFLFLVLAFGMLNLMVVQGGKLRQLSQKNCIRLIVQPGARGKILDRWGLPVVDNELSYDVLIVPQQGIQPGYSLESAAAILGSRPEELFKAYRDGYIASSIPITIARNIEIKNAIALEERRIDIPGIIIQPNPRRRYPYANLASHLIGYCGEIDRWRLTKLADYGYKTKDIVGFGGIEERYDYYLRQEEGGLSCIVDHRGNFVRLLGFQLPRNGKDIQLTIDLKIQQIAREKIAEKKGCVIVMDPYTGEILALVSVPDFNPEVFANKSHAGINSLLNNSDSPMFNRAISGAYPAGSLFKLVVAAAALETKKITPATTFFCPGSVLVGRQEFKCWSKHGQQNLTEAIKHSCNSFFYKSGLLVGAQNLHDYALKFGLSRAASFELPYEVSGFIPSPLGRKINKLQNWYDGDTANFAIGQGEVLVTPLQMARMIAAFANGGFLPAAYVVKAVDGRDISAAQQKITRLPFKKSTFEYIRKGLRGVVLDPSGTGNVLAGAGTSVAGKTGTAQAPPRQAHAWFAGYFPVEKPKFVICVFLENGGPGYYSCLIAKQIIEEMVKQGLITN